MTVHEQPLSTVRMAGRFAWHYAEMVIAMMLGMLLLGMLWDAVLPEFTRADVDTLVMAANMTIGMAAWMRVRRHSWPRIGEMSFAMVLPFLVLLVPYWFGVLSADAVLMLGHTLMFVSMALAMLIRRHEYIHHQHRLGIPARWVRRAAVVLVALLVPGVVSAVNTVGKFSDLYEARADQVTADPASKPHDPAKPTVAFLTSAAGSNAADLLGPYEVLAGTGRMNTYVVSARPGVIPLTGGLDLVPDLTFGELTGLLRASNDSLDAVVIPAVQEPDPAERAAIIGWLRQQSAAGAVTVSVCHGARMLAETGLLDGRPATSHWSRLAALREDFRDVDWTSGTRYVDNGNVITAAGVLSGIDGGLRIVERFFGAEAAHEAADRVHWRHYSPGVAASIPTSSWGPSDIIVALNASYQTGPSTIGVRLTDGAGEMELASAFMSYTEQSLVGRTVAVGDGPVHSRHGLTFVPRSTVEAAAGDLDRLLVPGLGAQNRPLGADRAAGAPRPEYLHVTDGFAFDPVLRDIARTYDVPTARFAAKTLEYPVVDVELTGSAWPWPETVVPVLLALLGAAAAIGTGLVFRRVRRNGQTHAAGQRSVDGHTQELVNRPTLHV